MSGALLHRVGCFASAPAAPPRSEPYGYRAIGVRGTGTGDVTPGLPTYEENDILLMACETNGDDVAHADYALLGSRVFTPDATPEPTELTALWRRATASEVAPTIADVGNHLFADIISIGGLPTTGDWWDDVQVASVETNSSTITWPSVTTTGDGALVIHILTWGADSLATPISGTPTNANLTGISVIRNQSHTTGDGGAVCIVVGTKTTAGATGNTTGNLAFAQTQSLMTIACKPPL